MKNPLKNNKHHRMNINRNNDIVSLWNGQLDIPIREDLLNEITPVIVKNFLDKVGVSNSIEVYRFQGMGRCLRVEG